MLVSSWKGVYSIPANALDGCLYIYREITLYIIPSDETITVDLVIQQLQDLECNWWAVGEAANLQQDELQDVSIEYT